MSPTESPVDLEFDPFSAEMMEDPYPTYKALRENAPVFWNTTRNFWAVTKYEDTRTVLKGHETFSNREGIELDGTSMEFFGKANILLLDPPVHKAIRGIFSPHFTPAKVREWEAGIQEIADDLAEELAEKGEADFAKDYGWQVPIETLGLLLGVPKEDRAWLVERILKAFKREPGVEGLPEHAITSATEVREYFGDGVEERRNAPPNDLWTALSGARNLEGEPMTGDEVGGSCLLLFAAGIITTGSFLSTTLYLLAEENGVRQRLIDSPEILPKAVEELWRYESPLQNTCRVATQDVMLGGQRIKEGDKVAVFPGSANRDEDVWADGETLDIDRDFSRNMVFGDGVHVCVGAHLARLEGRIGLQSLLARIPEYELAGPIERTDRVNERGLVSVPVTF